MLLRLTAHLGLAATLTTFALTALAADVPCQSPDPAAALAPAPKHLTPMLWRITGISDSFLYGTIHVPDERVNTVPKPVLEALESADVIYTESPMDEESRTETSDRLLLGKDDGTLRDKLPRDLYTRLSVHMQAHGHAITDVAHLKPWAVALQATMLEPIKSTRDGKGLDELVYEYAIENDKKVDALETVAEQLSVFEGLSAEEEQEYLRSTLDMLESYSERDFNQVDELISWFCAGDEDGLYQCTARFLPNQTKVQRKVANQLLRHRNRRLANRIEDKLRNYRTTSHFFAIGAAHMGGPHGVVAQLRERGILIERVRPQAAPGDETPDPGR